METRRTRRGRTPENRAAAALRWLRALAPTLLFDAFGLAIICFGVFAAWFGARGVLGLEGVGRVASGAWLLAVGLAVGDGTTPGSIAARTGSPSPTAR